jgi:hypothetical protein
MNVKKWLKLTVCSSPLNIYHGTDNIIKQSFIPRYETSRSRYETTRLRNVLHPSRLLRIRFSADLTMYWFPVYHFRCKEFKPSVIWIWNQNIDISTIVGTSSHIIKTITSFSVRISPVIQLSDRVYNVTLPAYDIYSLRLRLREYIS